MFNWLVWSLGIFMIILGVYFYLRIKVYSSDLDDLTPSELSQKRKAVQRYTVLSWLVVLLGFVLYALSSRS